MGFLDLPNGREPQEEEEVYQLQQGWIQDFSKGGSNIMVSVVARACTGVGAKPPLGSRGKVPGQGDFVPLKLTKFCNYEYTFLKDFATVFA